MERLNKRQRERPGDWEIAEIEVGYEFSGGSFEGKPWQAVEARHIESMAVYLTLSLHFNPPVSLFTVLVFHSFFVLPCDLSLTCFPNSSTFRLPLCTLHHTYEHTLAHTVSNGTFFTRSHLGFLVSICRGLASCLGFCKPEVFAAPHSQQEEALMSTRWP